VSSEREIDFVILQSGNFVILKSAIKPRKVEASGFQITQLQNYQAKKLL